ncbi:unannotated protein [freshwater metagenome]|uniref:Unannotated protein n=1 Tax=freshwater metagenome TaxID=449393 RepID=A0A6J6PCG4_9ZZZZ|nr:RluA family pseudouridine synthase [Actinomycetota bacterium]MSY51819.1 RluA family pseudouridine synthase [Actinomycetota bacterium]MSY86825.1 RluA family pseudouridine synthase [Actinomycetota bacterium]
MPDQRRIVIPAGLDGERVDSGISRLLGLSRTRAAELLAEGGITLARNGVRLGKSDRLATDMVIDVLIPEPVQELAITPQAIPDLAIVFQDDHFVVVDKPSGVAAHPSVGWSGANVLGGLAALGVSITTSGAAERRGIVQRLDVGTSGLMVVAKSEIAYSRLKDAFRQRTVTKIYHALVQGHPDPSRGTVDAPIGRHPKDDWRFTVMEGGRESITHYETLEAFPAASLLEIHLETGRTHQIRVHMSALRHPCVGDITYGADPTLADRLGLTRQWLHACELEFEHPLSGELVHFVSPYPADLEGGLARLRSEQ